MWILVVGFRSYGLICLFIGWLEAHQNLLEKKQQGRFRIIWKTLFGTVAMNQVELGSVIPF